MSFPLHNSVTYDELAKRIAAMSPEQRAQPVCIALEGYDIDREGCEGELRREWFFATMYNTEENIYHNASGSEESDLYGVVLLSVNSDYHFSSDENDAVGFRIW